jgi:hypothetical protein
MPAVGGGTGDAGITKVPGQTTAADRTQETLHEGEQRPDPGVQEGHQWPHTTASSKRTTGPRHQVKRRMCTFRTRPMPTKLAIIAEPP